jgi:hypothetical protein
MVTASAGLSGEGAGSATSAAGNSSHKKNKRDRVIDAVLNGTVDA